MAVISIYTALGLARLALGFKAKSYAYYFVLSSVNRLLAPCYAAQGWGNTDERNSLAIKTDTKLGCTTGSYILSVLRSMPQLLVMQAETQVCPIRAVISAWLWGRSTVLPTSTGLRIAMLLKVGRDIFFAMKANAELHLIFTTVGICAISE